METSRGSKRFRLALASVILIAVALIILVSTANTLPSGSMIGGVSVGGLSETDVTAAVMKGMNNMEFSIDGKPYVVTGAFEISSDRLTRMIKRASIDPFFRKKLKNGITIEEAGFEYVAGIKKTAEVLDSEGVTKGEEPKDAYVNLENMSIEPEEEGTMLDSVKLSKSLYSSIVKGTTLDFKSTDYIIPPSIRKDDPELLKELEYDKTYLTRKCIIVYPDGYEHVFTVKELSKFSVPDKTGDTWSQTINREAVEKYMKKHANYTPAAVTIKTKKGKKTLYNASLVGKVNVDKACDDITSALENGTEEVKLEWGSYPASDTRVEVSIAHQTLWYIENGKTIFSTPVVTGGPGHGTDKGVFAVTYKATDVDLKGRNDDGSKYSSHVDWWMPFNGDEGLHDADWRGSFGGNIYTYNGSHGCVNMPESAAARLYKKVDAGTIVVVY